MPGPREISSEYDAVRMYQHSKVAGCHPMRSEGSLNISGRHGRFRNSILALNTSETGPGAKGSVTSQGVNIYGDSSGAAVSPAQFSGQIGVTAAELKLGRARRT